ncbi:MAG TPA: CHAT domain-containing protein, partial [Polyangia bacterium]
TGAGDPAGAEAAYERALAGCRETWFPQICSETKIWLAYLKNNRRQIQEAKRWASEAKKDSQTGGLPVFEAKANARLAVAEDLRERFALARAYASEASLQKLDCPSANTGRELLAKIALGEGNAGEARRQLEAVTRCGPGAPRFGMIGTETLATLASDRQGAWETGRTWLRETIAQHRAQPDTSWLETTAFRLFEARVDLVEDRAKGQGALEALVAEAGQRAGTDEAAAMVRIVATSALAVDAGLRGEYPAALARLEAAQGLSPQRPCVLGAAIDGARGVFVARTDKGKIVGEHQASLPRTAGPLAVPKAIVDAVAGCDEVGVLATAPLLGQPRLLPPTRAWAYLRTPGAVAPSAGSVRRLVIYDARPPDDLGLPRLPAVPALTLEGAVTEVLQGAAATPSAALSRAMQADLVEWHVHGLLDPEISDAAALALSPEGDGRNLLTAADILKTTFPRKPGVILGACRAGQSARYGAYQWSLPLAFLTAGARWVIASPTPVEDTEAPAFFAGVWARIGKG